MPNNALAFILDQVIHLVTVTGAVFLQVHPSVDALVLWLNRIRLHQESILLVSVIYVFVIFGGGYFIRALIGSLWKEEVGQTRKEHEEVINAGLYIGWL